jgi:uncharacterized protein YndB with AHSA1/START domain
MSIAKAKRAARAVADVGEGTILAKVEIAAAPERVYLALTSPDELVKWWGSADDYRTTAWTADLKVGGRWRAEGMSKDGAPFHVDGEYLVLDPPRAIVHTWKAPWDGGHVTTVSYRLEPVEGGTRVVVRHEGFAGRADSCRGHADGWERVLAWLGAHVTPPAQERFYLLRLLAPRPTFMTTMTDDERAMMGEHVIYWRGHLAAGTAIVYGPVADPKGGWGVGVVRVADEAEVQALVAADPAICAGRGMSYEVLPMMRAIIGA